MIHQIIIFQGFEKHIYYCTAIEADHPWIEGDDVGPLHLF
jgi:hypothetical protein